MVQDRASLILRVGNQGAITSLRKEEIIISDLRRPTMVRGACPPRPARSLTLKSEVLSPDTLVNVAGKLWGVVPASQGLEGRQGGKPCTLNTKHKTLNLEHSTLNTDTKH